ncbi:unnamed protein product [Hymenolepis diminuta]|uniref:RRM domain-containing protein n=1 Tax=Hymenolepis diminuta TaxID=6216 RepID=A0A564Y0N0_HYMDI|nr:unnamed protein product [Hymenolepis diminuta]
MPVENVPVNPQSVGGYHNGASFLNVGDFQNGGLNLGGINLGPLSFLMNSLATRKIFVGGLPYETTDAKLREFFEQFGPIEEAVVITDRATQKSRGYGFVTMVYSADAAKAISDPNPCIDGRKANVNLAILGAKPRQIPGVSNAANMLAMAQMCQVNLKRHESSYESKYGFSWSGSFGKYGTNQSRSASNYDGIEWYEPAKTSFPIPNPSATSNATSPVSNRLYKGPESLSCSIDTGYEFCSCYYTGFCRRYKPLSSCSIPVR